jgi:hypothetical protein
MDPSELIVPTDVSGWSIVACYAGLIGLVLPCFAIPALICGIIALRKRKKSRSYGSVTSDIRAIIGPVLSSLAIVLCGPLLIVLVLLAG